MASPRLRAASMAIERFSLSLLCPVKSASRRGRSPASNCKSSAWRSPEISFRSGMCYQLNADDLARVGTAYSPRRRGARGGSAEKREEEKERVTAPAPAQRLRGKNKREAFLLCEVSVSSAAPR